MKNLNESNLSRILYHTTNHDTGIITAARYARNCGIGKKYSRAENSKRNKVLLVNLMANNYSVTSMKGYYIENYGTSNAHKVGEKVFFVSDIKDTGNLRKNLYKFGKELNQDSILFIPKGKESTVLIGTNKCPDTYPGWNKKIKFNKRIFGKEGEFFTSVKGRPFVFENIIKYHVNPQGFFGKWSTSIVAKELWADLIKNN